MAYLNPYPFQPPPPPQDPFRDYYRTQLAALSWNSRPIIQGLTMVAQDMKNRNDWRAMQTIVAELEEGIMRSAPHEKLSKLYLLDSISKNLFTPFTDLLFPPILPRLFLAAYSSVDGVTKHKMEEMLATWRTAAPDGGELFGEGVRREIEGVIFGGAGGVGGFPPAAAGYPPQQQYGYPQPQGGPMPLQNFGQPELKDPSKKQVLEQLERAVERRRGRVGRDAYDTEAREQIGVLEKIRNLLQTQIITHDELLAIQTQLSEMDPSEPAAGPSYIGSPYSQPQPPAPPAVAPAMDFGNLFKNLAASGLISNPSTPAGGGREGSVVSEGRAQRGGSILSERGGSAGGSENGAEEEGEGMEQYEEMILAMNVQLTLEDLQKERSFDPTSHLPNRCSQCSARFAAGKIGRERLQAHLDWHFRRNRKEREGEGRGGNRRWLPRAEAWISDIITTNPSPDGHFAPSKSSTSGSGTNQQVDPAVRAERRAALQKKWVVVPADPAKAATPCPICKERFVNEFSEDEEEWIWMNAIKAEGQIFHATCRADAMSTAVASRLLAAEGTKKDSSAPPSRGKSPRGTTPQPAGTAAAVSDSPLKRVATVMEEPVVTAEEEVDVKPTAQEMAGEGASGSALKRKADASAEPDREVKREKLDEGDVETAGTATTTEAGLEVGEGSTGVP